MNNDKTLALQIKDLLTVCLAKSIDIALTAQMGVTWFADFAQEDSGEEKRILLNDQSSVYACDMQALFKILRYRDTYSAAVLTYHGFLSADNAPDNAAKKAQFSRLMNRLITEFRNSIEAHVPAYALETSSSDSLYTYADAITDMLKLAEIFRHVSDRDGVAYYARMKQLAEQHAAQKNRVTYSVTDLAAALNVNTDRLLHGCETLCITVSTVDGTLCVTTDNYAADLSRLRAYFAEAEAARSQKSKRRLLAVLFAVLALILVVTLIIYNSTRPPAPEDNYYVYNGAITVEDDKINLIPKHVCWENDTLVVKCVITNGYDVSVSNITVTNLTVKNDRGIIARQAFGVIGENKALLPGGYAEWTFTFDEDSISIPNADLTDGGFSINVSVESLKQEQNNA